MSNELTAGSPEWIEDKVKKGVAYTAVWQGVGMVPSEISLRPDGITFDVVIGATPNPLEKDPTKSPEDRVRSFLEAAKNEENVAHGYKLGSLTIEPVKVNHPYLAK